MKIWKFALKLTDRQIIEMPRGAQFLSCQMQRGAFQLWAIVQPNHDIERRTIWIVGTGHPVPTIPLTFIDTVQQLDGAFVWHVFVEPAK